MVLRDPPNGDPSRVGHDGYIAPRYGHVFGFATPALFPRGQQCIQFRAGKYLGPANANLSSSMGFGQVVERHRSDVSARYGGIPRGSLNGVWSSAIGRAHMTLNHFIDVRAHAQHGPGRILCPNPAVHVERCSVQFVGGPPKCPHDRHVDDGVGSCCSRGPHNVGRGCVGIDGCAWPPRSRIDGDDHIGCAFQGCGK